MRERRSHAPADTRQMRQQLNHAQSAALQLLERLGWELRFVRQSPGEAPVRSPTRLAVPVIFAGDASWAVIRPDGSVDQAPRLKIRHPGL